MTSSDPQVALRLLRSCGGHACLVHFMRCVPSLAQQATGLDFDVRVRHCLARFTGVHLSNVAASYGTLATAVALGSAVPHAPAAYLASLGSCLDLCLDLRPGV